MERMGWDSTAFYIHKAGMGRRSSWPYGVFMVLKGVPVGRNSGSGIVLVNGMFHH